jgi:hypothetical protein
VDGKKAAPEYFHKMLLPLIANHKYSDLSLPWPEHRDE